jgi:FkbM family methyltransferase
MPALKFDTYSDGFSCYAPSREEARMIYAEIFRGHDYGPGVDGLPDQPVVVDVGANVGLFSIYVATRYPGARILAIEPVPLLVEATERNLGVHEVTGVQVHTGAVGQHPEQGVTFTYFPRMPGNSTRYPEHKVFQERVLAEMSDAQWAHESFVGEEITVDVERLSGVLAGFHPAGDIDLIKIDVEGSELDVLRGIDDADWPRVRRVILEVQDSDGRLATVTELLRGRGYRVRSALAQFTPPAMRLNIVSADRDTTPEEGTAR